MCGVVKFSRSDIAASGTRYRFDVVITIQKIRIADVAKQQLGRDTGGSKKKKGKAAKKRAAAAALNNADVIFDNPEEEILYSADFVEVSVRKCSGYSTYFA